MREMFRRALWLLHRVRACLAYEGDPGPWRDRAPRPRTGADSNQR